MGKHGPNRLSDYRRTHDTIIGQFTRDGFITADNCSFSELGDGMLLLSGEIECLGGVLSVDVRKLLEICEGEGPNAKVQTVEYSYNAIFTGRGNVFRYDSPHPHRPQHHAHRYAILDGEGKRELAADDVDSENWPTLGEVIGELREWYYENFDKIEEIRQGRPDE